MDDSREVKLKNPFTEKLILSEIKRNIAPELVENKKTVQEDLYEYKFYPVCGSQRYVYRGMPSFLMAGSSYETDDGAGDITEETDEGISDISSEKTDNESPISSRENYLDRLLDGIDAR